jgi:hypothetical protein
LRTGVDPYAVLGIQHTASGDEIAKAFRTRAKELHPDASSVPETADQFSELVAAYDMLSNHRTRREYDRAVSTSAPSVAARAYRAPGQASTREPALVRLSGRHWKRRTAWIALLGGTLCVALGVLASIVTWNLHETDALRHARFDPVSATRVGNGEIMFVTRAGQVVRTREPTLHGEGNGLGPSVAVRYDPKDPQHVVVDESTLGRDITLGIVALKLLIGGLVFAVLGARRLRTRRTTPAR